MAAQTATLKAAPARTGEVWRIALLLVLSAVIGTLIGSITGEKTSFLLKDRLGLSAGQQATIGILLGFPAYLQPFIGAWADLRPLWGWHRRSYYALACIVEIVGFVALASLREYYYAPVVALLLVKVAGAVVLGVMVNAVMVAVGNRTGSIGRLQSLIFFVPYALQIAYTAHLGGQVAQNWSYWRVFAVAALLVLLRLPLVFLIDEKRVVPARHADETPEERAAALEAKRADREKTATALKAAVKSPGLWAIVGYVFYLIITPGTGTAQLYFANNALGFSKQFIGDLGRWTAGGVVLGVLGFGWLSRRLPVRALVWCAFLMDCSIYLALLQIHDPMSARIFSLVAALLGTFYGLALYTLAARACPPGIEGTVYGLVLAAIALGGTLGDKIGAGIFDHFGGASPASQMAAIAHGWRMLCVWGFGLTVLAALFIPFLPAWTKSREPLSARPEPAA